MLNPEEMIMRALWLLLALAIVLLWRAVTRAARPVPVEVHRRPPPQDPDPNLSHIVYGGGWRFPSLETRDRAFAPHCDQLILHEPGKCQYCDEYPDWQAYRIANQIAFTLQDSTEHLAPDPAGYFRTRESLAWWPGNQPKPKPKGEVAVDEAAFFRP